MANNTLNFDTWESELKKILPSNIEDIDDMDAAEIRKLIRKMEKRKSGMDFHRDIFVHAEFFKEKINKSDITEHNGFNETMEIEDNDLPIFGQNSPNMSNLPYQLSNPIEIPKTPNAKCNRSGR